MATFEKQLIVDVNPTQIDKVFDLAMEYFEKKDYSLENSSKPSFASFVKGSFATDLAGIMLWWVPSRKCRLKYNISFKKLTKQIMLDTKLRKFGHIFTSADRDHFNNELNSLKEYINNSFEKR